MDIDEREHSEEGDVRGREESMRDVCGEWGAEEDLGDEDGWDCEEGEKRCYYACLGREPSIVVMARQKGVGLRRLKMR